MPERNASALRIWLALLAALGAASCDQFNVGDPAQPVGMERTRDGGLRILYDRCHGELVTRVAVRFAGSDRSGDEGELLWEISSRRGSRRSEFVPGVQPPGFDTSFALQAAIPADRNLLLEIDSSEFGTELGGSEALNEIPPGKVAFNGELHSPEGFRDAADRC